jgi:hypothetical protein
MSWLTAAAAATISAVSFAGKRGRGRAGVGRGDLYVDWSFKCGNLYVTGVAIVVGCFTGIVLCEKISAKEKAEEI